MYCPKCTYDLSKGEDKEFETLCDHVCDPNKESYPLRPTWVCDNPNCECSKHDVFWDEFGEYYGCFEVEFEHRLNSAISSFARKNDIEIYKKGLKRSTYLSPILMLWFLQPKIEFNYKADEYGNVLSKSWSLNWLKRDKLFRGKSGYYTYYTFPIMNIIRHLKNLKFAINNIKENGESEFRTISIRSYFKPIQSWDKRWWRHTELWLSKIIFRKQYKKSLK